MTEQSLTSLLLAALFVGMPLVATITDLSQAPRRAYDRESLPHKSGRKRLLPLAQQPFQILRPMMLAFMCLSGAAVGVHAQAQFTCSSEAPATTCSSSTVYAGRAICSSIDGYRAIYCDGIGTTTPCGTCSTVPARTTSDRWDCGSKCTLSAPSNGLLGSCSTSLDTGSACSFQCNFGYTLTQSTTTCCAGAPSLQQCSPNSCVVGAPQNGVANTCPTNLTSGVSCQLGCNSGFSLSGAATSCLAGTLTSQVCLPNSCSVLAPLNGVLNTCGSTLASGAACSFSCNVGYSLSSPTTSCVAGTLTAQSCAASCVVIAPNGGSLYRCPTSLASGATCQFACAAGFSLVGSETTCQDGTLTAQQCQPLCSVPAPANGAYNNCPTSLASGASCSITCNSGFAVVGSETYCSNGALVSQTCVGAPCPVAAPTNGALNGCPASLPSGSSCAFSCNAGYTLVDTSTSCLAGVLTAQTCLTPQEIAAANAAKSGSSSTSGVSTSVQNIIISILSTLGGAAVAFGGWYWKRSNDARKRTQRRALAAAIFAHLPIVDAGAFDSPTGQEFTDAVDALAQRVRQQFPNLLHGLLITHPRLPSRKQNELGQAISTAARNAGLELNASTMPSIIACVLCCRRFKGALVTHFSDEHMQRAIVAALQPTLEASSMQATFLALSTALEKSNPAAVYPMTSPNSGDASSVQLQSVGVELVNDHKHSGLSDE
jgi:hypothetical protein